MLPQGVDNNIRQGHVTPSSLGLWCLEPEASDFGLLYRFSNFNYLLAVKIGVPPAQSQELPAAQASKESSNRPRIHSAPTKFGDDFADLLSGKNHHLIRSDLRRRLHGSYVPNRKVVLNRLIEGFGQDAMSMANSESADAALAVLTATGAQYGMPFLDVERLELLHWHGAKMWNDLVLNQLMVSL